MPLLHDCQATTVVSACVPNFCYSSSHLPFSLPLHTAPFASAFIYLFSFYYFGFLLAHSQEAILLCSFLLNQCCVSIVPCCSAVSLICVATLMCLFFFVFILLRSHKQLLHCCRNRKPVKGQLKVSSEHLITKIYFSRLVTNFTGKTHKHQARRR